MFEFGIDGHSVSAYATAEFKSAHVVGVDGACLLSRRSLAAAPRVRGHRRHDRERAAAEVTLRARHLAERVQLETSTEQRSRVPVRMRLRNAVDPHFIGIRGLERRGERRRPVNGASAVPPVREDADRASRRSQAAVAADRLLDQSAPRRLSEQRARERHLLVTDEDRDAVALEAVVAQIGVLDDQPSIAGGRHRSGVDHELRGPGRRERDLGAEQHPAEDRPVAGVVLLRPHFVLRLHVAGERHAGWTRCIGCRRLGGRGGAEDEREEDREEGRTAAHATGSIARGVVLPGMLEVQGRRRVAAIGQQLPEPESRADVVLTDAALVTTALDDARVRHAGPRMPRDVDAATAPERYGVGTSHAVRCTPP